MKTTKLIEAACAKKNYKLASALCQKLAVELQLAIHFPDDHEKINFFDPLPFPDVE